MATHRVRTEWVGCWWARVGNDKQFMGYAVIVVLMCLHYNMVHFQVNPFWPSDVAMVIWINIGSGYGLVHDGTCDIHLMVILQVFMNLIRYMCSEITLLKLLPHLPGANESKVWSVLYLLFCYIDTISDFIAPMLEHAVTGLRCTIDIKVLTTKRAQLT